jgi:hypothetical protein
MPSLVALALLAGIVSNPGQAAEDPLRERLFHWFDSLAIEGVAVRPFVRVDTWSPRVPINERQVHTEFGFLVSGDEKKGSILKPDLLVISFPNFNPRHAGEREAKVSDVPLDQWAENRFRYLGRIHSNADRLTYAPFPRYFRTEAFVLSRACAARGLSELSARFFTLARSLPANLGGRQTLDFEKELKEEMAEVLTWQAVVAAGDGFTPRTELHRQFGRIEMGFLGTKHHPMATELTGQFATLIEEDLRRMKRTPAQIGRLPAAKQVEEWIFQLRDQHGGQFSQPGSPTVFLPGEDDTPAHHLYRLGFAAVPALIEALSDDRPIRAVGYHRDFYFSHRVLRVRDAALQILQRLSGQTFGMATPEKRYEGAAAVASMWWDRVRKMGEKEYLLASVRAGGPHASDHADLLIRKYPNAAFAAIKAGIESSAEPGNLIFSLGRLGGPRSEALVRELLKRKLDPNAMLAAARIVAKKDPAEAVGALAAYLREPPTGGLGHNHTRFHSFLIGSGYASSLESVRRDLSTRPSYMHAIVAVQFTSPNLPPRTPWDFPEDAKLPESASERQAYRDTAERLLGEMLESVEEFEFNSLFASDTAIREPRIADIAGYALSRHWPEKYSFKPHASPFKLEVQRVRNLNAFRKGNGLPELSLPERPSVPSADIEKALGVLTTLDDAEAQRRAAEEIESKGVAAVPPLLRALKSLNPENGGRQRLYDLTKKLATYVREVRIEGLPEKTELLKKKLEDLRGASLSAPSLVELLSHAIGNWPAGIGSLRLRAVKENDGSGFLVSVVFLRERIRSVGTVWGHSERVRMGHRSIFETAGGASESHFFRDSGFSGFASAVERALDAPPEEVIVIAFDLTKPE